MERETTASMIQSKRKHERERFIREALKNVEVPAYVPPTPAELARRQKLAVELDRFRAALGPLPFSLNDLIREDRDEGNEAND